MKLYRYEAVRYSSGDEEFGFFVSPAKLILKEFEVVAKTPKGFWITFGFGGKDKWVSLFTKKRFAATTKEQAMVDYKERKLAYVKYATNRLNMAKEELGLANV